MSMPLIVTHPSTIFHDGLRRLFSAKSGYRPVRIATALTPDLESYIGTLESCVWLAGDRKLHVHHKPPHSQTSRGQSQR